MEIWVIDTSSIIHIRELMPIKEQIKVYATLTQLVDSQKLVYPKQVLDELKRYTPKSTKPDRPLEWALFNEKKATRSGPQLATLKTILAHTQVRRIFDPEKVGVGEADPHVLALAYHLSTSGEQVTVLSEERKDRPDKLSMTTACAHLRLICMPIDAFLAVQSIWP